MLFNSVGFLIFFPVVTIVFFLLYHQYRWMWLLAASCFFYMFFKPEYILILAFTIVIDYYAGLLLERETDLKKRKRYLVLSLVANIGVLAIFKYFNFINDNITGFVSVFNYKNHIPYLNMILPIGLSFHTFQAMSYTIEVYKGNHKAEKHFGIYALYVMFYPQLVAGPIERPQNILYQFHSRKYFNYDNAVTGLRLIAWGLFKKIVIADRLALYVNQVYADVNNANSLSVLLAIIFFSLQIYTDFSGYSDIARGAAKVMGYDLLINFNAPFKSKSISEFWRRWHISLSTWFFDYLYYPLALSFRDFNKAGIALALLITFFLSGLWHGAGWTFILYGVLHGAALVYELYTKKIRKKIFGKLPVAINVFLTRLFVLLYLAFSWVFFRSENLHKVKFVFSKLFELNFSINFVQLFASQGPFKFANILFTLILCYLLSVMSKKMPGRYNVPYIFILIFLIIILGENGATQFIYFQF